jgi:hypothetical protein
MKDELAEQLLAAVMQWRTDQVAQFTPHLQALAQLKYDHYEIYRPGVKFVESLASWLSQFATADERRLALDFVLKRLVFVSRREIDHAIEAAYRDVMRPTLLKKSADRLGMSRFAVRKIANTALFRELRRKTLVLGLSDGARLDKLRRSGTDLSHEQFYLVPDVGDATIKNMHAKLAEALIAIDASAAIEFEHVFLVDDFSGSGYTLIHRDAEAGAIKGKLIKTRDQLAALRDGNVLAENATVSLLLYLSTEFAVCRVRELLREADMDWHVDVVQLLPEGLRVTAGEEFGKLCEKYFDPAVRDRHLAKGGVDSNVALGFSEVGLPLVLPHNTPNNSVALLWADTTDNPDTLRRRALFPRYERHHEGRQ